MCSQNIQYRTGEAGSEELNSSPSDCFWKLIKNFFSDLETGQVLQSNKFCKVTRGIGNWLLCSSNNKVIKKENLLAKLSLVYYTFCTATVFFFSVNDIISTPFFSLFYSVNYDIVSPLALLLDLLRMGGK